MLIILRCVRFECICRQVLAHWSREVDRPIFDQLVLDRLQDDIHLVFLALIESSVRGADVLLLLLQECLIFAIEELLVKSLLINLEIFDELVF